MPLFTRSNQTPDRAGAATDEGLPSADAEDSTPEEPAARPAPPSDATPGKPEGAAAVAQAAEQEGAAAGDPLDAGEPADAEEPTDAERPTAVTETPDTDDTATGDTATGDDEPPLAKDTDTPAEADADETPATTAATTPEDGPTTADPDATPDTATPTADPTPTTRRAILRARHPVAARVLSWTVTLLAAALVLVALLLPNKPADFRLSEFARIPVEALLGAAVLIALPRRPRLVAAVLGGLSLGVLTLLNLLDIGFNEFLGRGFNVVLDWSLLGDAQSYLEDSVGEAGALAAAVAVVVLVLLVPALMAFAVVRLGNLMARHTATTTRATLVLSTVWMTCASLSLQVGGVPIASEHTAAVVRDRAARVKATIRDERGFAKEARADVFGNTPGSELVPDLRGKDIMFTFIESYGRSAVEDPVMSPGVDATLDAKTGELAKAGFHAKSGWLTSATYGGSSWLGHSTFLSGLWIDNQNRYRTVTAGDHLTLTSAFKKTGDWRTVGIMPGVQKGWPEAKFYGLDHLYDAHHLGYQGPKFSWSTMPDQYALAAFQRLEHGRKHDKPLMSEIILTSSHQPWAPIPKTIPQDQVGDGSVYDAIQKAGKKPADVFYDSTKVKQEYGKSIQYSVTSLIDYVVKYGNKNTVLVFLGDHQPMARVSGDKASRDVPVAIVAHDPKVLDKITDWGYSDGLRPAHDAPVWKMSAFRDRFLTAYGSTPRPSKG
ncbi:sulfatase [Streptomyces avermitilis]|uniref:sulfatase n=1 Tax=Streptomyces avermitilis TaxID=33903 RepID=UPI0033B790EF